MGLFRKSGHAHLMLSAGVGALMLGSASVAWAQSKPINVAPQTLASALHDFGSQTGRQIFFKPELAASKVSPGVAGATDEQLALTEILQGTGLTFRREANAFIIEDASDPQSGSAAGDGADQGTVQALVVTAQKREENIQDVPIAMSAFTQEDLTKSQIAGGPDLMTQIPNFTFTKTNFSSYSIQIRGIGTQAISATTDPAVAIAFNNTPFVRNRFFEQEFYDLERVEVLRGPQGTLYGRNATAGVVNIISAKPNLHEFQAKLSADVANYSSTRLEGMLNLPIVDDKVAFRVAGAWTKRDGYDTNEITGHPIDGRDLWSARATLRFEPTDWLKANLIYEHFDEDDDRLRSGKQLCKRDFVTQVGGLPVGDNPHMDTQRYLSQGCLPTSLYSPEAFQVPNGFALPYYQGLTDAGLPATQFFDAYTTTTQSRNLRVIDSTVDPHYRAKSDLGELQISLALGGNLTLVSETGYNKDFIFSSEDFNRFNTASGAFDPNGFGTFLQLPIPGVLDQNGVFCDPQVGCSDRIVAVDLSTAKSRQFSQEFRLSSDYDGPFNFSLGANFLRYDTEDKYYVFFNTISMYAAMGGFGQVQTWAMPPYVAGLSDNRQCQLHGMLNGTFTSAPWVIGCVYMDPNPIGSLNDLGHNYFLSKNPYKLISYATFGEAYYKITPSLKLTAGLRWMVDKKEAPRIPSWLLGTQSVGYPVYEVVRQEWREPTGRLALDWKPDLSFTDDTLLYASYSHGYKAGGANPPPPVVAVYDTLVEGSLPGAIWQSVSTPKTFDPEFVNAFELGTKNTLSDGRLTLNADAFYYDYKGYQVSQIVNRSAVNYNFDAKVWGLELEADWRPLENLRLGFKGGYEDTRIAKGEHTIDIMDRTAGNPDWVVMRPFATVPSNCIMPKYVLTWNNQLNLVSGQGVPSMCDKAYINHVDPLTWLPYTPYPQVDIFGHDIATEGGVQHMRLPGYPGFDPSTAPNNGEGFFKELGGHQLPNAPHYTATVTADYTIPLPHDWLATLHTDFYYQSEAWARVFNMPGYDKLKAYTNVNVAAIFANEDAGWQVMAYVKNVFNKDNITGSFLNSDDTGLTTNVFLNEPRLYGLRVTKQWTGAPWWLANDANHPAGVPYPLTVELAGFVERHDAPNTPLGAHLVAPFAAFHPLAAQDQKLDWGDGRQVSITYNPAGRWQISMAARFGSANHVGKLQERHDLTPFCIFPWLVDNPICDPTTISSLRAWANPAAYTNSSAYEDEDHVSVDFLVGREVGFGVLGSMHSTLNGGLRYARLTSRTDFNFGGIPDWIFLNPDMPAFGYEEHDRFEVRIGAHRQFEGAGPVLNWDAAHRLFGNDESHVDLAWTLEGGVLFGRQKTDIDGSGLQAHYYEKYFPRAAPRTDHFFPLIRTDTPFSIHSHRSQSASVPTLDLSAGLSWEVERFKVGVGYNWERYYNAIDGGVAERKTYDRSFDGPYFKVSIGFGG